MKKLIFLLVFTAGLVRADTYRDNGDGTATKETIFSLADIDRQISDLKVQRESLLRGRQSVLDEIAKLTNEDLARYDEALIDNDLKKQALDTVASGMR